METYIYMFTYTQEYVHSPPKRKEASKSFRDLTMISKMCHNVFGIFVLYDGGKKGIILFYRPQSIIGWNPDRKSSQEPRGRDWSIGHNAMLLTDLLSMACSNYFLTSYKITSYNDLIGPFQSSINKIIHILVDRPF